MLDKLLGSERILLARELADGDVSGEGAAMPGSLLVEFYIQEICRLFF